MQDFALVDLKKKGNNLGQDYVVSIVSYEGEVKSFPDWLSSMKRVMKVGEVAMVCRNYDVWHSILSL